MHNRYSASSFTSITAHKCSDCIKHVINSYHEEGKYAYNETSDEN